MATLNLSPLEITSILISAAIHDYNHPGTNNAFHIANKTSFAILYNDKTVLENYHVSAIYTMFQNCPNLDVFAKFDKN